jgi:hypothetical protein
MPPSSTRSTTAVIVVNGQPRRAGVSGRFLFPSERALSPVKSLGEERSRLLGYPL